MPTNGWFGYTRRQALTSMPQPKLVTPDYYAHASFGIDPDGEFFFCGGGAGGYGIVPKGEANLRYLLALLNSRLLDWYLQKISLRAYQTAFMYVKKYHQRNDFVVARFVDAPGNVRLTSTASG